MMILWIEAVGCTHRCRCCPLGGESPAPAYYPAGELRRLAEAWGPLTPLEEATVHPEFPAILDRSITPEGNTYLGTSGEGIARAAEPERIFRELRACGYECLFFALHGLEDRHDPLVGRPGAFRTILKASRLAREAGFWVHWKTYLHRHNLEDIEPLAELADRTYGGSPYLSLLYHRIHPRLRWYESLRPALRQVEEKVPGELIAKSWGSSLPAMTEEGWMSAWRARSGEDSFRHLFEPRSWPVDPAFENLCLSITRDRKVYFNPMRSAPMLLGEVAEGRDAYLERLTRLSEPRPDLQAEWPRHLREEDRDLLHPAGTSVRYNAFSAALRQGEIPGGVETLDFCGHF